MGFLPVIAEGLGSSIVGRRVDLGVLPNGFFLISRRDLVHDRVQPLIDDGFPVIH